MAANVRTSSFQPIYYLIPSEHCFGRRYPYRDPDTLMVIVPGHVDDALLSCLSEQLSFFLTLRVLPGVLGKKKMRPSLQVKGVQEQ